jgi:drug/metabolite transporter (DMT)-like permease
VVRAKTPSCTRGMRSSGPKPKRPNLLSTKRLLYARERILETVQESAMPESSDRGARHRAGGVARVMVIFPPTVTYFLNLWSLRRVSPTHVTSFIYLQPLFTTAVAPLVLEVESLTLRCPGGPPAFFQGWRL